MMKTILLVSPYLPYKNVGHAGGKAIYDFIVYLKKRNFKVCLLSLVAPDEVSALPDVKSLCDDTCFLISEPILGKRLSNSFLKNLVSFVSAIFANVFITRPRLNHHLIRMIDLHEPDIIQVEFSNMALYINKIKSEKLKILHLHDVLSKPFQRLYLGEKIFFRKCILFLFFTLIKQVEICFCRRFDRVLAMSEFDRDLILKYGNFHVEVFPLGIQVVPFVEPYESREANSVLFVGAMNRWLNEQAVLYFIKEVMPRLEAKLDRVKFFIVGAYPSITLRNMPAEKVVVTGFVEDLSLYYNRCKVFVAPLFIGGGMIFKILQAMSYGLPVVSSTIANEGIQAKDNKEILIADSPEDFCNKTSSLLTDKNVWERISSRGRSLVNAKYSWDVVLDNYLRSVHNSEAEITLHNI